MTMTILEFGYHVIPPEAHRYATQRSHERLPACMNSGRSLHNSLSR